MKVGAAILAFSVAVLAIANWVYIMRNGQWPFADVLVYQIN